MPLDDSDRSLLKGVAILLAVIVAVGVATVGSCNLYHWGACEDFCRTMGEKPYYSMAYGCFCEDRNGRRYNPDWLAPDGVEVVVPRTP